MASSEVQPVSILRFRQKLGYALGHVFNDFTAGVWYSYTLLFLQNVQKIGNQHAGALMMLGQVVDAIATVLVGFIADKYGTKRQWHALGVFLVFISFAPIYAFCPYCEGNPAWQLTYYSITIFIFQCAWPIVQISHLAMIPELGMTKQDRADLTALRYSAIIVSVASVFCVMWYTLGVDSPDTKLSPSDAIKFRNIALILTAVGCVAAIFFQLSLSWKGKPISQLPENAPLLPRIDVEPVKVNFFKRLDFYQNGTLYVVGRVCATSVMVFLPLWLSKIHGGKKENIATVPLVSFIASFVASVVFKQTYRYIGARLGYLFGGLVALAGCAWVFLDLNHDELQLYSLSILLGMGHSLFIIASLNMTADMIGNNLAQSGSVYSSIALLDKLITGIAIFIIESIRVEHDQLFYQNVLAIICGIPAIIGILALSTLYCTKPPPAEQQIQQSG